MYNSVWKSTNLPENYWIFLWFTEGAKLVFVFELAFVCSIFCMFSKWGGRVKKFNLTSKRVCAALVHMSKNTTVTCTNFILETFGKLFCLHTFLIEHDQTVVSIGLFLLDHLVPTFILHVEFWMKGICLLELGLRPSHCEPLSQETTVSG